MVPDYIIIKAVFGGVLSMSVYLSPPLYLCLSSRGPSPGPWRTSFFLLCSFLQAWPLLWPVELMHHNLVRHLDRHSSLGPLSIVPTPLRFPLVCIGLHVHWMGAHARPRTRAFTDIRPYPTHSQATRRRLSPTPASVLWAARRACRLSPRAQVGWTIASLPSLSVLPLSLFPSLSLRVLSVLSLCVPSLCAPRLVC